MRRRNRRTTIWAYLDGKKLVDVVRAALDNSQVRLNASYLKKSTKDAATGRPPEIASRR